MPRKLSSTSATTCSGKAHAGAAERAAGGGGSTASWSKRSARDATSPLSGGSPPCLCSRRRRARS
eukprot:1584559-Alexandrium_andersonii.AAC.1